MDALATGKVFLFEGFRLDRRGGGLFRRDECGVFVPMAIGSRALDLLGVLVEWPGDVISRDAIIVAVWPSTVVADNNLNMQIAALRRILDQGRAGGSCIQTVAGRGYRFVAAVTRVASEALSAVALSAANQLPALPDKPSIAVLPFANMSGDPEQEYFADGMVEEIITALSRIRWLFVDRPQFDLHLQGPPRRREASPARTGCSLCSRRLGAQSGRPSAHHRPADRCARLARIYGPIGSTVRSRTCSIFRTGGVERRGRYRAGAAGCRDRAFGGPADRRSYGLRPLSTRLSDGLVVGGADLPGTRRYGAGD